MNEEYKIIIAFVFNRSGKKEMSFSDFYLTLSLDLNWFNLNYAKNFTKKVVENNLLKIEKELIKPTFNIDNIKIPTGFYPSKKALFEIDIKNKKTINNKEDSILKIILEKIVEKSNLDKKTIIKEIKELEKEKNITAEIASMLIAKQYLINLNEILKKIEGHLLFRN